MRSIGACSGKPALATVGFYFSRRENENWFWGITDRGLRTLEDVGKRQTGIYCRGEFRDRRIIRTIIKLYFFVNDSN